MSKIILIFSFLIFAASFVYADDAVSGKKVITVATLSNFQMVAKPLVQEYLKSKGINNTSVDIRYVIGVSNEELIQRVLSEPNIDIVFAGDVKSIDKISEQKTVYNNSIYAYGHISLITGKKDKTIKDFMSCKFDVLVVPDPNKTTYGISSMKFLNDNKIRCPKAEMILTNNTLEAGAYLNAGADFVITTTSVAVSFENLRKSGDDRYKTLTIFDLAHQPNLKPPVSMHRHMLILNKDYVNFAEFMHTNTNAHSILETYGFGFDN